MSALKRAAQVLHNVFGYFLRGMLQVLVLLAFRPKLIFASEKARQEAFSAPQVIICNHIRGMDAAMLYVMLRKRKFIALTARDLQENRPFFRFFMSFMPTIVVDRQHASLSWLRESRRVLKDGRHIMIFPEGYCNQKKVIQPFKPGFVMLAASAGAQILPMYIDGEYHPFLGRRCRMIVGEPVSAVPPPEGLQPEAMTRLCDALLNTMRELELQLNGYIRVDQVPS